VQCLRVRAGGLLVALRERWPASRWLLTRLGAAVVWILGFAFAVSSVQFYVGNGTVGMDARAYWLTGHEHEIYTAAPQYAGAFLYSPAFAMLVRPLTLLPWSVFLALWMVMETAAFVWLLAPMGWRWAVPALLWCVPEVVIGNVYAFLALAAVIGMRRPLAWASPLLTKVTPGVGVLWFVGRGQWRLFLRAVVGTLIIAGVSFLIAPKLWADWIRFLIDHGSGGGASVVLRLVAATLLVLVAARINRPWLVAPAMLLATPVIAGISAFTMLTSIPRLAAMRDPQAADPLHVPPATG
jgi:hypothetical protein